MSWEVESTISTTVLSAQNKIHDPVIPEIVQTIRNFLATQTKVSNLDTTTVSKVCLKRSSEVIKYINIYKEELAKFRTCSSMDCKVSVIKKLESLTRIIPLRSIYTVSVIRNINSIINATESKDITRISQTMYNEISENAVVFYQNEIISKVKSAASKTGFKESKVIARSSKIYEIISNDNNGKFIKSKISYEGDGEFSHGFKLNGFTSNECSKYKKLFEDALKDEDLYIESSNECYLANNPAAVDPRKNSKCETEFERMEDEKISYKMSQKI